MAILGNLSVKVLADVSSLRRGMFSARNSLQGFQRSLGGASGALSGNFMGTLARATPALIAFGAAGKIASSGIKQAAQIEQLEVSLSTLTGSAAQAKQTIKEIREFSASTPFQFEELGPAAKKLLAFGTEANNLIPTMRRIGDVSAGIGAPIGEIAEIYGKARVSGRLFMEDINQLTGRGIPIIGELAKQFGVAESEVRELVSSGKVNFSNLEEAFVSMTSKGGQFAGLMEAQSGTLAGVWSTLKDNLNIVLGDIGTEIVETFDLKNNVKGVTEWVQGSLRPGIQSGIAIFKAGMGAGRAFFGAISQGWIEVKDVTDSVLSSITGETTSFSGFFSGIGSKIVMTLAEVEFAFMNWRELGGAVFTMIDLKAVNFYEDLKFIFLTQIPAILGNFVNINKSVFTGLFNFITTIWDSIWEAIKNRELPSLDIDKVAQQSFASLKEELDKIPDLADRPLSDLENSLTDSLSDSVDNLLDKKAEFMAKRLAAFAKDDIATDAAEAVKEQAKNELVVGPGKSGKVAAAGAEGPRFAGAAARGSAEAFSAILNASRRSPDEEVAKNTAKTNEELRNIAAQLAGRSIIGVAGAV